MAEQRTLILEGCPVGKSVAAERLLAAEPEVLYVATGGDGSSDPEWAERIAKHRARRLYERGGWRRRSTWCRCSVPGPPLLIDCLTLWLRRARWTRSTSGPT